MAQRLIDHLRSLGFTNREAHELLETGKVFYHGIPTADIGREVDATHVKIIRDAPRIQPGHDLVIVYHDKEIAVIYKPSGMLSTATHGRRETKNVIKVVEGLLGKAYPVHRIDEPTSGLLMVALTERAQEKIRELLFKHDIERRYLAIVAGTFPQKPCTMRTQLVRDRGDGLRGSSTEDNEDGAKEAVTHFKLVEHLGRSASIVEAKLETGRTHQVRIHLSEMKFPILGDDLYATRSAKSTSPRLALHAFKLGFKHPSTGKMMIFEAPLADDLEALRRRLQKR